MTILSSIVSVASVVLTWAHANLWAIVAGFLTRHVSPTIVAKVEAVWNAVDAKVKAAVAWVKSKL